MVNKNPKRVLITGGPTNEYIDEVMKITNMSSGKLAIELATYFAETCKDKSNVYHVTLMLTRNIKNEALYSLAELNNVNIVRFETTQELQDALYTASQGEKYDIVIHSAAVADYKPEFSFRMEDMADEIAEKLKTYQHLGNLPAETIAKIVMDILKNPDCKVNDDTKISSVEPNLTVKLGLTTKIIANLREWFPDAFICGFKLLENVSECELVDAAMKQIKKCNTNLVFANDLAELRHGNPARLVVTPNGYKDIKVDGAEGIYHLLNIVLGDE